MQPSKKRVIEFADTALNKVETLQRKAYLDSKGINDFIARMKTLGGEEADTAARLTVEVWKEFRQNFQPNWKGYFNAEILRSAR